MTAGSFASSASAAQRLAASTSIAPQRNRALAAGAAASSGVPIYFGPVDSRLFGWLHAAAVLPAPATVVPPLAVLLCAPLGHEDLATHRGLRRLACALAAAGVPVLRFDHAGWGDSAALPARDDAVDGVAARRSSGELPARWLRAIDAAADELRLRSGAPRLALAGVRMGALLAALAASGRDDVAALLAILPVASGQSWLRECRLLGAAAPADPALPADADVATEIGGLVLKAADADAVAALRWPVAGTSAVAGRPPAQRALLIERDDLSAASASGDGVAAALRVLGVVVDRQPMADLGRLTAVAHSAHTPPALIEHATAWLVRRAGDCAPDTEAGRIEPDAPVGDGALAAAAPGRASASAPIAFFPQLQVLRLLGSRVVERTVCIDEAPRLVGVLATPAAATPGGRVGAAPRRGLLLLASGAERRIGPHGLWTAFARQRAAAGDVVLRLDLAGIGDSDDRPGASHPEVPSHAVYDPRCVADIAVALDWLRAEWGVGRCDAVGLCSGAYHAWRAALAGVALSTVVSVNPVVFHWKPGMSLDPVAHAFGRIAITAAARRSLRDPKRWVKLLRGQVNLPVITAAVGGRLADLGSGWARGAGRLLGVRLKDDLAAELRAVTGRGVRLCFVFAEGDPGRQLLVQGAGRTLARLLRRQLVSLQTIAAADHTFTRLHARQALYRTLQPLLDHDRAAAPSTGAALNGAGGRSRFGPARSRP